MLQNEEPPFLQNQQLVRRINRCRVLDAFRCRGDASRAQLAEILGLDRKSLTNIVGELIEEAWVVPAGTFASGKGRPHELLSLSPNRLAAGIVVEPDHVHGVLCDPCGRIVHETKQSFRFLCPWSEIRHNLKEVWRKINAFQCDALLGLGLATPAVVDHASECIEEAANIPGLAGITRKQLSQAVGVPLILENASAAIALAEKWHGRGREHHSFLCVNLGIGVGAGLILERRLYRGAGGVAGELGHVVIVPGGNECRCGNRGCLEAYLGERILLDRFSRANGATVEHFSEVDTEVQSNRDLVQHIGEELGAGLAAAVNLLSPAAVFLAGGLVRFWGMMREPVLKGLAARCVAANARRVTVLPSVLEAPAAVGAACSVWSKEFEVEGYYYV